MNNDETQPTSASSPRYDVAVIGGGAAGLSAALVLGRARRRVVVVDAGRPRNAPAAHMQGFLGSDGLPPTELLARGRQEITGYGVELISGSAVSITTYLPSAGPGRRGFDLALEDGSRLTARSVLVTTGLRDEVPQIPGVRERWGRDVLHCPYCHGFEVSDQPIGVLCGSASSIEDALAHALLIRQWSDDVILFANGVALGSSQWERLLARSVQVVEEAVTHLTIDNDGLTGVVVGAGRLVPRTAVFVRPRFAPNDSLLTELGCAAGSSGWITVDGTGATSIPGIWAAGNAVNPRAQVITAAGEGSAVAIAINNRLVEEDVVIAVAAMRDGVEHREPAGERPRP